MNELKETTQPLTLTKNLRFCHPPTQSGIKMYMNFARSKNRCAFFVKTLSINHADVFHFYNSYVECDNENFRQAEMFLKIDIDQKIYK